jgi:hypothetical protein
MYGQNLIQKLQQKHPWARCYQILGFSYTKDLKFFKNKIFKILKIILKDRIYFNKILYLLNNFLKSFLFIYFKPFI